MSSSNIVLLSLILVFQILVASRTLNYYDLCKNNSGHKIYLEFEEIGLLKATNLTNKSMKNESVKQECYLEIITCPSCIIVVNFSSLNLSQQCDNYQNVESDCCEYIQISEHPYEYKSTKKICGNDKKSVSSVKTLTRNIKIQLIYQNENNLAFSADYKSISNKIYLTQNNASKNYLLSPYFPSYYLNDLAVEYIILCNEKTSVICRIQLMFTDFQLGTMSIMEFFDGNGQRLEVITGIHFRPPVLISNGASLTVRFYANGGTGLGYKAEYSFITDSAEKNDSDYATDCGGYVDNLGGGITMMNMVQKGLKKYYCFWIIKPPKNYLHFKTYLYLKIANFTNMEGNTELIIHKTTTSSGKILEVLRHPNTEIYSITPREHIQSIETGFFVSLKGSFGIKSRLAIVYTAFSYKECFSSNDFLCENHRCIPRQLTCDGFDHCGDGSDEPTSCYKDLNPEPGDRTWYSRRPNYFFPKIDPYSDVKTATLIFIMSSLGLISLVSALFVLLYRINHRARHERELQNHLQIITDLLEEEIIETESIPDEPPLYEAPPNYEEVIKVEYDSSGGVKPKKPKRKKKRNKSVKLSKNNTEIIDFTEEFTNQNLTNSSHLKESIENINANPGEVKHKRYYRKSNAFLYFSDKAISKNVKLILKRKWHSQGELNIKKYSETSDKKLKSSPKVYLCSPTQINLFFSRETASDSELLNITSENEEEYKKSICECQGACCCVFAKKNEFKKYAKKFNKKVLKKKKFYTN